MACAIVLGDMLGHKHSNHGSIESPWLATPPARLVVDPIVGIYSMILRMIPFRIVVDQQVPLAGTVSHDFARRLR